ncbi:MAG: hypothetical protein KIT70_11010 [Anaerolineales bacterium]|nr:MAG: hypothetical protein KIT70_11010 [Anaerolineales bacterium]
MVVAVFRILSWQFFDSQSEYYRVAQAANNGGAGGVGRIAVYCFASFTYTGANPAPGACRKASPRQHQQPRPLRRRPASNLFTVNGLAGGVKMRQWVRKTSSFKISNKILISLVIPEVIIGFLLDHVADEHALILSAIGGLLLSISVILYGMLWISKREIPFTDKAFLAKGSPAVALGWLGVLVGVSLTSCLIMAILSGYLAA